MRMSLGLVGNRPESQPNAFLKVTLGCRCDVIPSLRDTYESMNIVDEIEDASTVYRTSNGGGEKHNDVAVVIVSE